ncbi:hypothetical protein DPV78_000225 [Talaromyces pinophilus]|nr:hypothetical protein DPV78_000225 [Talaromyces pinophilus]
MGTEQRGVAVVDQDLVVGVQRVIIGESEGARFCWAIQYIYPTVNSVDGDIPDTIAKGVAGS